MPYTRQYLLEHIRRGKDIVIRRHRKPVARLVQPDAGAVVLNTGPCPHELSGIRKDKAERLSLRTVSNG